MRPFLGALLIFLIVELFLIALGIGVGFLLHWVIPGVEAGTGILIGVVATAFSIQFFARLMNTMNKGGPVEEGAEVPPQASYSWIPTNPRQRDKRNRRSS